MAGLWTRLQRALVTFGAIYAILVAVLAIPGPQKQMLYLHNIKLPFGANLDTPEKYGLAPGKTLNLRIHTPDNLSLGAWFVFSEEYYHKHAYSSPGVIANLTSNDITQAIQQRPTIIFFHGNAATRAQNHRAQLLKVWPGRANVNVLAVDYRGFADSEGSPSEEGLEIDGRAAWTWLIEKGAHPSNIVLFGHSLGTAVVAKVAHTLNSEGVQPRGVVLAGAFTDLATLLETYNIAGLIPVLQPFQLVPFFFKMLDTVLYHKFNTLELLPGIDCPILLVHGENDFDINVSHSQRLFESTLEPYLEPYPFTQKEMSNFKMADEEKHQTLMAVASRRRQQTESLVEETPIFGLGTLSRFDREGKGSVNLLKTKWGGHNPIINFEGVMDMTRSILKL